MKPQQILLVVSGHRANDIHKDPPRLYSTNILVFHLEDPTPNTDEEEPAKGATQCHLAGFRVNPRIHPDHDHTYVSSRQGMESNSLDQDIAKKDC